MRAILWLISALMLTMAAAYAQSTPAQSTSGQANPGVAPLFTTHTGYGLACVSCHDEQPAAKPVETAVCLSCHGSHDDLADLTDEMGANNPHASHNGPLDCDKCHHVHKASENFCQQCHAFDMDVP